MPRRQAAVSIEMVAAVLKAKIAPASHKLAAILLAEGTNTRSGVVWRSIRSVASCVGVSPRQAQRILRDLQALGVLVIVSRGAGGAPGAVPVYRLSFAKLQELQMDPLSRGDTHVTRTKEDGRHRRPEGRHTCRERGDMGVTRTGIGTRRKPEDAHAHTHAGATTEPANSQQPNSRHPEEDQSADAAKQRLRDLAVQIKRQTAKGVA